MRAGLSGQVSEEGIALQAAGTTSAENESCRGRRPGKKDRLVVPVHVV